MDFFIIGSAALLFHIVHEGGRSDIFDEIRVSIHGLAVTRFFIKLLGWRSADNVEVENWFHCLALNFEVHELRVTEALELHIVFSVMLV